MGACGRLAFGVLASLAAGAAGAAPLPDLTKNPAPSWTYAPPADPGCLLKPPTSSVALKLTVRSALRRIGPYVVELPGYSGPDATKEADNGYTPYLIAAKPGDSLLIDLVNQLPKAEVNLHTHGLVTQARPYSRPCNSPGDYIFAATEPNHDQVYRINIPTRVKGIGDNATPRAKTDYDEANPFPTGVYWIHAHIHGAAKNDVWAGQSALLDIEDPKPIDDVSKALAALPTRYVALRELQLAVAPDQFPADPAPADAPAVPAAWLSGDAYITTACTDASTRKGFGWCARKQIPDTSGKIVDADHDLLWLFTVNGALAPEIEIKAQEKQRWKIANLSSVVTYVLDLAPPSCDVKACADEHSFEVVKVDGVVTGEPSAPGTKTLGVKVKQLLLPPAARAEILVYNPGGLAADKTLALRTLGFETGGKGAANGDPWPAVQLAKVTLKSGAAPLAQAAGARIAYAVRTPAATAQMTLSRKAAPRPEPVPRQCVTLPGPNYRRCIVLSQTEGDFRIGSKMVPSDAACPTRVDEAYDLSPSGPIPFEHGVPPGSIPHVCAKLGTEEIWEVLNITNELHNFHIHQTKFTLAKAADRARFPGLPANFTDADAFLDPTDLIASQVDGGSGAATVKGVDVWHDTLPVPPAQFDASGKTVVKPGRIVVRIPFRDQKQVGTYVFHCHILEHEDKGMMAEVEVYAPANWTASRSDGAALLTPRPGFCGPAPANASDYALPASTPAGWRQSLLASLIGAR